ncbi:hypothetical protein [Pedobacter aquatilis]|uniref:hypothetical protein n=1 Tax=Pedobacter aquatilis TaxID=351343 RepID=UPI00292F31EC|nr:hypothetical protein [Pedobacter aquatilis]
MESIAHIAADQPAILSVIKTNERKVSLVGYRRTRKKTEARIIHLGCKKEISDSVYKNIPGRIADLSIPVPKNGLAGLL